MDRIRSPAIRPAFSPTLPGSVRRTMPLSLMKIPSLSVGLRAGRLSFLSGIAAATVCPPTTRGVHRRGAACEVWAHSCMFFLGELSGMGAHGATATIS